MRTALESVRRIPNGGRLISRPSPSALGHGFRWLSVLVAVVIAGCAGGADPSVGKSELNVIVPDGGADSIDIGTVEYTISCDGNSDTFLDNDDSFPDEVLLNGNLEVTDGQTSGSPPVPTEVWQAFMDLPPGPCVIQLRARDNDGEVLCVADDTFTVTADSTTKINLVLVCNISFQAPVGMADVDATFSFVVGNFCPDLFVLNCLDSNPAEVQIAPPPAPPIALTSCEVRFRDGDSTCGNNCDPQLCDNTVIPPVCTPGPDPGVSTMVTCTDLLLDCDGDGVADPSCTWAGDTTGVTGAPPPNFPGDPGAGNFFVICIPPGAGGTPGLTGTCTAVTTDGDVDCDKTKTVDINCPGIPPCEAFFASDGSCDDGNDCTANACDDSTGAAVCVNDPLPYPTPCFSAGPGTCDGAGGCLPNDCSTDADCANNDDCTSYSCLFGAFVCVGPTAEPSGTPCDAGSGPGSGACDGFGLCIAPPGLPAGSGSTTWSANTTPPGSNGGPTTTGGGSAVFVTVLNSTVFLQVDITLDVTSDGANNITTDWTISLRNFLLPTVADAAELGAVSIGAVVNGATPSFIPSTLTPAATGQTIGTFTNGDALTLSSPGQITRGSATIFPTGPAVSVEWDGNFSIELTLGGNPLITIDQSTTSFDVEGGVIDLGETPCSPTANPPPPPACFDDGNECTADSCNSSSGSAVCVNARVANGTACTSAPTVDGVGSCQNGLCLEVPTMPAGSGTTTWAANTTPVAGGGAAVTGGGCGVSPTVLGTTIFFDTTVVLEVTSDGNNNITTDWTVLLQQFLLPSLSNAAEYGSLDLNAVVTGGLPSSIPSTANPAVTGQLIGNFLSGDVLAFESPGAIDQGVAAITPGAPGIKVNWDGAFDLALTLGGNPLLTFDESVCTFNVQGAGVSFGDLPCSATATPAPPPGCFDDGSECTVDSCDDSSGSAVCINDPAADGTACTSAPSLSGLGKCQAGACVSAGCTVDGCSAGTACTLPQTCNASTERCEPLPADTLPDGTSCDGDSGTCQSGSCVDNCAGIVCSDGNDCTADPPCDSGAGGICPASSNEPAGTFCDPGTSPVGECDGAGTCVEIAVPRIAAGSGQTVWQARTTPVGSNGGPTATGGGCVVFVTAINATIFLDVSVTLDVNSDGLNNITTGWIATLQHYLLPTLGNAAEYGGLSIGAAVTGGTPSVIQSLQNPLAVGQVIGNFTTGDVFMLVTPTEITEGSANVVPNASSVNVNWDGTFLALLTLGGTPLVTIDESVCTFDVQGTGVDFAVTSSP